MFVVEGKVALVTGGASGMGFAFVKKLLNSNLKGVCVVDVNEEAGKIVVEDLKKEYGAEKVIFVKADISNKNDFEDAFKKTVEQFKNLDIVINNAGILDDHLWEKEISINVNGNVYGNLLALEYIQKHKNSLEGVIVNVASIASMKINGFLPIYTATKHAVLALSRSFGLEVHYNRTKVKVISICPGPTQTPLIEYENKNRLLGPEYKEMYLRIKPNLNYQLPSHVAENLVKLIEDGKSGSVWVIENNETPYEVEIPAYSEFRKK